MGRYPGAAGGAALPRRQARGSLAHELELCRFDKGEAIVSEGDEADGVYVLHEGAATVEKNFECDPTRRLSALLRCLCVS